MADLKGKANPETGPQEPRVGPTSKPLAGKSLPAVWVDWS